MDYVTSICVKKPRNIGCIIDQGSDYYGKGNVSVTGKPCLPWADPNIKAYLSKRLIDSGADTKSVTYASLLSISYFKWFIKLNSTYSSQIRLNKVLRTIIVAICTLMSYLGVSPHQLKWNIVTFLNAQSVTT